MFKRIAFTAAAVFAVAGLAVSAATAASKKPAKKQSSHMLIGINDEADTLYGNPDTAFATLKALKVQVLRVNLYWGGTKWAVANSGRPTDPTDPGDPAYNWALYDRLVEYAHTNDIQLVFSIVFTPSWANGGKGKNVAPTNFTDLENFAYAAAERYSGLWIPPSWQLQPQLGIVAGQALPRVSMWTAWNEPNSPVYLTPQYKKVGRVYRAEAAYNYARICNAVYDGVHSPYLGPLQGEQVACGVTDPKGSDNPRAKGRQSIDPMTFFVQAHRFGMKTFDVYAHHPYSNSGKEAPNYVPKGKEKNQIQLGNISKLLAAITKFYGPKHLWITEYGYQTPPDRSIFSVPLKTQAKYMAQAVAIARRNPRIDMFLWFQVRDEPSLGGWQSGLETIKGKHKPSWTTFIRLPRG